MLAWTQLIGFDGDLAEAEPATFRTRILHIAARTATRVRRSYLHIDTNWPWTRAVVAGYQRIRHVFTLVT